MLCGMALMGVLSFSMFPVQAAWCSHEKCYAFYDVKTYYFEEDGHYGDVGPSYICADCGYQYWDDSALQYQWVEHHQWSAEGEIRWEGLQMISERHCETSGCPITLEVPLN